MREDITTFSGILAFDSEAPAAAWPNRGGHLRHAAELVHFGAAMDKSGNVFYKGFRSQALRKPITSFGEAGTGISSSEPKTTEVTSENSGATNAHMALVRALNIPRADTCGSTHRTRNG